MGSFSLVHWVIVLAIIVLVFGSGKLKNLGSDLGASIKGFKRVMICSGDVFSSQLYSIVCCVRLISILSIPSTLLTISWINRTQDLQCIPWICSL